MATIPEWAGMDDFPGEDYTSEPGPVTLRGFERQVWPTMKVGDLVTGAECSEGEPRWLAAVEVIYSPDDGLVIGYLGGDRGRPFTSEVRPITDAEAVALVEALTFRLWGDDPPTVGASRILLAHLCRGPQ